MVVRTLPEGAENVIPYEVIKSNLDLNDGEMIINLSKKERDYEVQLDICMDYTGGLVMGTEGGDKYVAQITVPARSYTEKIVDNPNPVTDEGEGETGTESKTIVVKEPVPFSMDNCTLILWEMEV